MHSSTPPAVALAHIIKPAPRVSTSECTVDFDEVQLHEGSYPVFSWRATVAYADVQNYFIEAIELPLNYFFDAFTTLDRNSPLWAALADRTRQMRDQVEAAILADIDREAATDRQYATRHAVRAGDRGSGGRSGMSARIAYADPPYIGCAHLYADHPDFAGEVDHAALVDRLQSEFDGWVLHTSATATAMAVLAPLVEKTGARWMSWVKGFAAFKRNVSVAYAWEPVIVKAARKPVVSKRLVMRDWIEHSITLKRGLTGAKPEAVCHWAFEMVGARPDDELHDLFPGSGAVSAAWKTWQGKFYLPDGPLFKEAAE